MLDDQRWHDMCAVGCLIVVRVRLCCRQWCVCSRVGEGHSDLRRMLCALVVARGSCCMISVHVGVVGLLQPEKFLFCTWTKTCSSSNNLFANVSIFGLPLNRNVLVECPLATPLREQLQTPALPACSLRLCRRLQEGPTARWLYC